MDAGRPPGAHPRGSRPTAQTPPAWIRADRQGRARVDPGRPAKPAQTAAAWIQADRPDSSRVGQADHPTRSHKDPNGATHSVPFLDKNTPAQCLRVLALTLFSAMNP